jgi:hypothetical protein
MAYYLILLALIPEQYTQPNEKAKVFLQYSASYARNILHI